MRSRHCIGVAWPEFPRVIIADLMKIRYWAQLSRAKLSEFSSGARVEARIREGKRTGATLARKLSISENSVLIFLLLLLLIKSKSKS